MVCSAQKVKVAVKSAKIGAFSHVTNSILKNAAKWSVYASTVTNVYRCRLMPTKRSSEVKLQLSLAFFGKRGFLYLHSEHVEIHSNTNLSSANITKSFSGRSKCLPLPFNDIKLI